MSTLTPSTGEPASATAPAPLRAPGVRVRWFAATSTVFVALLCVVVSRIVATNGDLVYAIDDPYIHLALARTFADTGTWGLTPGAFESASSAPLWTLGLSWLLQIPGVPATWWPLVANLAAGLWLLWTVSGIPVIERFGRDLVLRVAMIGVPLSFGMVTLALLGMEHLLHAALVAEVVVLVAALVDGRGRRRTIVALLALLAAGCLIRPETAFVGIGVAVAVVVVRRAPGTDRRAGGVAPSGGLVALGALAAVGLSLGVHAAWNLHHGQYAVPNSVAAKSSFGEGFPIKISRVIEQAMQDPAFDLALLASLVAVVLTGRHGSARRAAAPLVVGVVTAVGILTMATVSSQSLDRYQSFAVIALVVGVLLFVTRVPGEALPAPRAGRDPLRVLGLATAVLLLLLAALRLPTVLLVAPSSSGIHRQQEQMGRFLAEQYQGRAVMVNDLGWVAYLHDGPILDLAGLGTHAVVRAQKDGQLDRSFVESLATAQGTEVAVVFDRYFAGAVPAGWTRVGQWCLDGPAVTNGDRCVSWYAPAEGADRLRARLAAFTPSLPDGVTVQLAPAR